MPHPPFITLDENSDVPLYRQIYEAVRRAVLSGEFHPTMPLPASRALANQLGISRMTVLNAYDQLFAEGYLESRVGSGTFVAAHLPEEFLQTCGFNQRNEQEKPSPQRRIRLSDYGKTVAASSGATLRHLGLTRILPFQHGLPAVDEFPFEVWGRIAQRWHKKAPPELLCYGEPAGYRPLRKAIAAHLASSRAVRCAPEQIIVTNGTQQALGLIGSVFLQKGEDVWVEDPCYFGARDIFAASGARVFPVPIDAEGFDVRQARKMSRKARLVYVTPSHQFPLGVVMSLARRLALLEWARETGSFIVEDDYDSEYRYGGRPLASLQGLDSGSANGGRVIYVGTFSKTIFPALRLGYLVVPPDLIETFAAARALNDLHSPLIEQAILAEFIGERHFSRHLRRMRKLYEERQQILVAEAGKHLKGWLEVAPAEAGMHLIGWLPADTDDQEIASRVREKNLRTPPVSAHCINQTLERGGLILGYTAFNEKQIKSGIKLLAKTINGRAKPSPRRGTKS